MRRPRALRRGQETACHCMSRAMGGQHLFKRTERDAFRCPLRELAAFCQVQESDCARASTFRWAVRRTLLSAGPATGQRLSAT